MSYSLQVHLRLLGLSRYWSARVEVNVFNAFLPAGADC